MSETELKDLALPNVDRFRSRMVIVAGIAIIASIAGLFIAPDQFYKSYLLAFMFWIGLTLGSLGLLMMQHLTGGAWGIVIRRNCEAVIRLFPLMLLLFVPLIFAVIKGKIYIWSQNPSLWTPEQHDAIDQKARYFLNNTFFIVRVFIYFGIWILFSWLLNKYSRKQDETGNRFISKT